MKAARIWKSILYPWIPSSSPATHGKRRKGLLYRWCATDLLECQKEQDRLFWKNFLHPERQGRFLEVGGDGITGSHTLGLELIQGWTGAVEIHAGRVRERARGARKCEVLGAGQTDFPSGPFNLLAIHDPFRIPRIWDELKSGRLRPRWVIVENREPDPQWCRLLEGLGYRLRFFFHDDEYYKLRS